MSFLNLSVPGYPDGLTADVTFDRSKPLESIEVDEIAIMVIADLGRDLPWNFEGFTRTDTFLKDSLVELTFRSVVVPRSVRCSCVDSLFRSVL